MAGFGGAVKLTGETQYKAALKSITMSLKEVNAELKVVTSAYDKNDTSTAALTAKQEVLNRKLEQQKSKLSTLKSEYAAMEGQYAENTQKHNQLVDSYNKESAKLKQLESTVGTTSDEYKRQAAVVKQLESEVKQSAAAQDANAKSMSNMRVAISNAQADINKTTHELNTLESELQQAASAGDELGDSMKVAGNSAEKAEGGFTVFKGAVANLASSVISGAVNAVQDLAREAVSSSDALYKFGQTMGFAGYNGKTIKKAKADMKEYADRTVYDLDTVSNTTAQLAANGIKDFTGLTQAAGNLNAVAGGNADTFKSVAMVMTQTAGAGKLTTENWNQLADAIPGASGRLQEAMRKNGAFTGDFREAMAKGEITADEFNQAIMELGSEPVAVEAAKSVDTFEGAIGNMQAEVVSGLMEIIDAIGMENLTGFINAATTGIKALIPIIKTLVELFPALAAGVASYLAYTTAITVMTKGWQALTIATKAAAAAKKLFDLAIAASPMGLFIASLSALAVGLVIAYNRSETFRNIVNGAFRNVKQVVLPIVETVKSTITTAWAIISSTTSTVWSGIQAIITAVASGITAVVTGYWNIIKTVTQTAWSLIQAITSGNWGAVRSIISNAVSAISSIVSSVFGGVSNTVTSIWNAIRSTTSNVWNGIRSAIESPMNAAANAVRNIINRIKGFFNFRVSWPHIPLPHFSISPAGWNVGQLLKGKIPKLSIRWYATGGVIDRPTVLTGVGENGAEAIVPLEKNTGWIKRVAGELMGMMATGANLSGNLKNIQAPQEEAYRYNSIVDAFREALSQMTVELDDDSVGRFVVKTVENEIYT